MTTQGDESKPGFIADKQELKPGLILFRRRDVAHRNWYCRIKLPKVDRYKTVSLKTADINTARERAYDAEADIRFRIRHEVPVFNRPFSQIAAEYVAFQKKRADAGQITHGRVKKIESTIRSQLDPYVGTVQIHLIGKERWEGYAFWRREHGEGQMNRPVSGSTIRYEMVIFRGVLNYAASRRYITDTSGFEGNLSKAKERREAFNPDEYRKLHTYARSWIKEADGPFSTWYRTMAYLFILIMSNTGMRPPEGRNLRWRDVQMQTDREGRKFVVLHVRGKAKTRQLVAPASVAEYFERVRTIAKVTDANDPVFTTFQGKTSSTLYRNMIEDILVKTNLRIGPEGSCRSTYSFRHTYATFRLTEGVDVYILAQQMGTSVKMIEDHYGHISPIKNAAQILQGMPGWQPNASPQGLPQPEEGATVALNPKKGKKAAPRRSKPH